jgi:hypothetical protein
MFGVDAKWGLTTTCVEVPLLGTPCSLERRPPAASDGVWVATRSGLIDHEAAPPNKGPVRCFADAHGRAGAASQTPALQISEASIVDAPKKYGRGQVRQNQRNESPPGFETTGLDMSSLRASPSEL